MKIIPTIFTASADKLEEKIQFLGGKADWVQIDVTDSKFGGSATFPLEWLDQYQDQGFFWDIHLMVNNPFSWVEKCNLIMAQRVIGQVELMSGQHDFLDRVESEGMEGGLALDLATPIEKIDKDALWRCGVVLLLGVKAGKEGQEFNKSCLKKIKELCSLREEASGDFLIGVDGGVNRDNLSEIEEAGADIVYVGSAIWKKEIKLSPLSQKQL